MAAFLRLIRVESLKLRRSAIWHVLWILPLVFLILDYRVYGRQVLANANPTALQLAFYPFLTLKSLAVLWAGLIHPLLLALLPPLLVHGEHRSSMWKHLHTLPVSRRTQYLAKALTLMGLHAGALLVVALGLRLEWSLIVAFHLKVPVAFQWMPLLKTLGWMYLGSLPVLCFYLWIADRISAGAVPIILGFIGLMLTIALAGQEMYPLWQRDVIPWVLPYTCTQRSIEHVEARQEIPVAALPYQKEYKRPDLPKIDETKLKVRFRILSDLPFDDDFGLKPPDPTPTWMLVTFSLVGGVGLLGLGLLDAGRNRA